MQSQKNRLFIAAAGAGKTTFIVKESAARKDKRILITTFTEQNEVEIRNKFRQLYKKVPEHITIQTWFSFLLEHGVRPYQSFLFDRRVEGMKLVAKQSAIWFTNKDGVDIHFPETNIEKHYFNEDTDIYSDKIAKFAYQINKLSKGVVLSRLERIYDSIYIDEVQDLSGYDLELVKIIANSTISLTLVGDPRQVTYHTHWERKNKKYLQGKIKEYIEDKCKKQFLIDLEYLQNSYRNNASICLLANQLFPAYSPSSSISEHETTDHEGIFGVREKDVDAYLSRYYPAQLRYSRKRTVNELFSPIYTFGEAKGKTFNRVLIYPTTAMLKWLKNRDTNLEFTMRCKTYVAITRAIHSVAFVIPDNESIDAHDVCLLKFSEG